MKITYIDDTAPRKWSGGITTELAIWPPEASYQERNFLWRLSTAEVREEESVFTSLPDYERLLTIREGSLKLQHDGGDWYTLSPGQITRFDGASDTVSRGMVTDFNLMLRKGAVTGSMSAALLDSNNGFCQVTRLFPDWEEPAAGEIRGLFVSSGELVQIRGNTTFVLHPEELALFSPEDKPEQLWLREETKSLLIAVRIRQV